MTFYVLKKQQCSMDAETLFDISIHQLIQTEEFANIIAGNHVCVWQVYVWASNLVQCIIAR
jgi:hypothetical protein